MTEQLLDRRQKHRLAVFRHADEVTGNVAATCRYYGISRSLFHTWRRSFDIGPDGEEIPLEAQFRGPACRGLTNIGIHFDQYLGASLDLHGDRGDRLLVFADLVGWLVPVGAA